MLGWLQIWLPNIGGGGGGGTSMSEGQSSASGFFVYVINIFQFDDFAQ